MNAAFFNYYVHNFRLYLLERNVPSFNSMQSTSTASQRSNGRILKTALSDAPESEPKLAYRRC